MKRSHRCRVPSAIAVVAAAALGVAACSSGSSSSSSSGAGSSSSSSAALTASAPGITATTITVGTTAVPASQVQINYPFDFIVFKPVAMLVPGAHNSPGDSLTMQASVVMRNE